MKAQLCPVCQGSGNYKGASCHGCHGRGWVTVPEDRPVRLDLHSRYPRHRPRPPAHSHLAK